MKGWTHIYTSEDALKVDLLIAMLREHDITTSVIDKKDQALVMIGNIEIYVPTQEAERAISLIKNSDLIKNEEE